MALPERVSALLGGPAHFRFILQPILAILLGIRDGRLDAEAGRNAFLLSVLFVREGRREALQSGIRSFIKPFVVSVVLDMIVQLYLFHEIRVRSALLVGILLIALPYAIARGLSNRFIRWRHHQRPGA